MGRHRFRGKRGVDLLLFGATRVGVPPQVNVMGTFIFLGAAALAVLTSAIARRRWPTRT